MSCRHDKAADASLFISLRCVTGDTSVRWLLNNAIQWIARDVFMIQKAIMMYPDCVMHILAIRAQQSHTCLFFAFLSTIYLR